MDESHRLKPFDPSWDHELFEKLYYETIPLRKKLASKIDCRRFGVDYDEILSWFDIKFTWAYSQYMTKYDRAKVGDLKGYIIRALQQYSFRVMRNSYQLKYKDQASVMDITELVDESLIVTDGDNSYKHKLLEKAIDYLKHNLSDDAFFILQMELDPPAFIIKEMEDMDKTINHKIPNELIAEYLSLPLSVEALGYVKELRRDIHKAISSAKLELVV